MARLVSPTGITVNVGDAKAEQLQSVGYKPADGPKSEKAPEKKPASKSTAK